MRKCGVAFARGLLTAAAFSTVSAQAQTPAEVKYPVRLANGFSVARESQAGREYCLVSGLRAMPAAGTESASVSVMTEIAFDTKGNSSGFGQIQIDAKETSFTNREEQPVKVRVELDGVAQDMPWGEVVNAVFTFLKFRFPAEYLNKVAAAKSMKVYTVDPTTKAAKLFATADVSGFAKAAEAHAKCTNSLSADFPTKLGQGWEITRETNSTCSLMMMGRYPYGIVRDGKGKAVLLFSEDDGEAMVEPIVFINDFPVETEYGGRDLPHVRVRRGTSRPPDKGRAARGEERRGASIRRREPLSAGRPALPRQMRGHAEGGEGHCGEVKVIRSQRSWTAAPFV